jgi:hypothetical protein
MTAMWQGKELSEIWNGSAAGSLPKGHWYLYHLSDGDGFLTFAIAAGAFMVIPAMSLAGIFLFREGKRITGVLAFSATIMTLISILGFVP